jgi:hypothetical protein
MESFFTNLARKDLLNILELLLRVFISLENEFASIIIGDKRKSVQFLSRPS